MAEAILYERIQKRLETLGLKAETASVRAGMGRDGIRNIKRGKSESPRSRNLKALADVLECTVEYLLGSDIVPAPYAPTPLEAPPGYVAVLTIAESSDTEAVGASAAIVLGPPKYFEEELVRYGLQAQPGDLRTTEILGQSMEPLLHNRDRVLIDTKKISLAEPGLFVLWDGGGLVCKWVQRVYGSNPPRLRLRSENPRFEPYEVVADATQIIGRVVWFARQM